MRSSAFLLIGTATIAVAAINSSETKIIFCRFMLTLRVKYVIGNGHGWIGTMAERRNALGTHSFIRTFVERPIENWILNIGHK